MKDSEFQIANIRALTSACDNLGIDYEKVDKFGNSVRVKGFKKSLYFSYYGVPFNDGGCQTLLKDKILFYSALKGTIRMPKTISYLDPKGKIPDSLGGKNLYRKFVKQETKNQIIEDILSNFEFPVVIKMNSGTVGRNVFICKEESEIKDAIDKIFDIDSRSYDKLLLAQEYIPTKKEYRALWYKEEVVLLYEKKSGKVTNNISPLHSEGATAIQITDNKKIKQIEEFLNESQYVKEINFSGFDCLEDKNGKFWLLEGNGAPSFAYFVRDNGIEPAIEMYEKILKSIQKDEQA